MPLVLITAPTAEPVTLAEARDHLRLESDDSANTAKVTACIMAARQWVERVTGRALVTQTWEAVLDEFPCEPPYDVELARGVLQAVTSIKYLDLDGVEQTAPEATYLVDTVRARVLPAYGLTWPSTRDQVNAVRVRFTAGYGAPEAVPSPLKAALLLLVGHLFEHRESEIVGAPTDAFAFSVDALLAPFMLR